MAQRLTGIQGVLLYKVGGASAAGDWVEAPECGDLAVPMEFTEDECTTRGAGGVEQYEPTTMKFEPNFTIRRDPTSATFIALSAAFFAQSIVSFRILDYVDGPGWQADCKIFKFPTDQKLKKVQTIDIVAKHCLCDSSGYLTKVEAA